MALSCIIWEIKPYIGRESRFLPRDAYTQRGLYRSKMSVRPSVRLSVTRRYSVETAKHIISFSPSCSQTITAFVSYSAAACDREQRLYAVHLFVRPSVCS